MPYLLALTLLLAPAYALQFKLFGFSTDVLMVWVILVWMIFGIWLVTKKRLADFWKFVISIDKKILVLVILFFLAGIISLFTHGFDRQKLGQFIVLFLEPISIFFIGRYIIQQFPRAPYFLLLASYLLLAAAGFYAIIQYFTLIGLPAAWWGNNNEPKRALSFFIHPNFYALWAAPLLAFLIPDVGQRIKNWKFVRQLADGNLKFVIGWLLGCAGLFLSLSRAGWLGLAAAIAVYILVAADKKTRKVIFGGVIIVLIVIFAFPNLRYRLLLPFYGEKSAVSRFSLWETGWKGIKESPITGLGLTGFARQWPTLNTDPGLATATHNFPHNIFLDLWVETGLLGLISLTTLVGILIFRGLSPTPSQNPNLKLSVSLFLIALVFAGLVDNPYFKNDLAMVFWIILSVV